MAEGLAQSARGRHAWPEDGCCANCGTELAGHWCHHCGQRAADHHRSLGHLVAETVETLTHADGRLWRTISLLLFRPARLTRDYLRGKRASEIPPLRLFFVTLLVVFAAGGVSDPLHLDTPPNPTNRAEINKSISTLEIPDWPRLSHWMQRKLIRAADDPPLLFEKMNEWGERFAILLLPLSAIVLRIVIFPFRRGVTLYDHMIFTMHSLSFAGFAWVAVSVPAKLLHMPSLQALMLVVPVHLFAHLRGVYGTSVMGTLWRMFLLFWCSLGVFVVLMTALSVVSLGMLDA